LDCCRFVEKIEEGAVPGNSALSRLRWSIRESVTGSSGTKAGSAQSDVAGRAASPAQPQQQPG